MINYPSNIDIQDYNYILPDDKIASFPLKNRDNSKLLIYKNKTITNSAFNTISDIIPDNSTLVFNNTKVIPARFVFTKSSGSAIEIFCLNPISDDIEPAMLDFQSAFAHTSSSKWNCLVGNSKRWKDQIVSASLISDDTTIILKAQRIEILQDSSIIKFSWTPELLTFSEIMTLFGITPLPPYIKRKPIETDKSRYQTIYALNDGSVAAPTAGLHFTQKIIDNIKQKNTNIDYVTLHIGAGTFKPISTITVYQHNMHFEVFTVTKSFLVNLINNINNIVIAVGTTSARTLESLYWLGIKEIVRGNNSKDYIMTLNQTDAFNSDYKTNITSLEALNALILYLERNNLTSLQCQTQLFIMPGYKFRIVNMLITNFHQPKSTLLLLVSAFIGSDWKKVYDYALNNNFRFLSYGDSSILFPI